MTKYYKNINQLYLNQFDNIPEFNILKNYRLKLMNDENYVNDLLMTLNINGNYTNDINILIERLDLLIYCVLIVKMSKILLKYKDEFNGLIFEHSKQLGGKADLGTTVPIESPILGSSNLNAHVIERSECGYPSIKECKLKVKQYEPIDLYLLKKYNVCKIFDSYKNNEVEIEDGEKLITLISDDFQNFKSKNKDIDDKTLKNKINNYCELNFINYYFDKK